MNDRLNDRLGVYYSGVDVCTRMMFPYIFIHNKCFHSAESVNRNKSIGYSFNDKHYVPHLYSCNPFEIVPFVTHTSFNARASPVLFIADHGCLL